MANHMRQVSTRYIPEVLLLAGNLHVLIMVSPNSMVRALIGLTRQAHYTAQQEPTEKCTPTRHDSICDSSIGNEHKSLLQSIDRSWEQ
jgi:hypothetical protein